MNSEQWVKVLKGLGIGVAGAVLTWIAVEILPIIQESKETWALILFPLLSTLVNVLRKLLESWNTPTVPVLLLALTLSGTTAQAQTARYRGRTYTPESFPRATWCGCDMCQRIRNQWSAQGWGKVTIASSYQVMTPKPVALVDTQDAYEIRYRTETRTRTTYQRKCMNGVCTLIPVETTYTVSVPYRVKIADKVEASIPVVDTPKELAAEAVKLLGLGPGDRFLDPGCGSGYIVEAAAATGAESFGIEIEKSVANQTHRRLFGKARIYHGDSTKVSLSGYTHVYLYLYPDIMEEIVMKLDPGTKIVSYYHEVPGLDNKKVGDFYIARVPSVRDVVPRFSEEPKTQLYGIPVRAKTYGL